MSNPVNWTDPSGRCIGWIWQSQTCQFAGFDPRDWNYEDGAAYATGVASNVVDPVVGVYTLATNGEARDAAWQQLQNIRPSDIPGILVDGVVDPFRNLYNDIVCDDSHLLGRGVGGVGIEVIGAAAGISAGRRAAQAGAVVSSSSPSGIRWLGRPGFLRFRDFEVRGVRDLSHISEGTLRAMKERGFAATDVNGERLILHHLYQNPDGPLVEIPASRHSIGNRVQHPYGNMEGMGLTAEERALFNEWRSDYWKARATEELARRGIE